jgi:hypothetical protein
MSAANKNESPVSAGQVVKSINRSAINFKAKVKESASGFYLQKGIDVACMVGPALLLLVAVSMALPHGFIASLDLAGLMALGGVLSKPEQLSFLPPPPFNPQWPTKGTLGDRALKMLMDGRMIDHPDFENSTQSWRLGAVIFTLRTLGWPVETVEIPSPTEQSPDRVIALYRLDAKYTAQALALNGGVAW